ncbi:MAG: aminomethyl-transferring glycine dehydrogenase subunit GcvPB [Chloroflexota bacterium]|nr:aminomethyl-transferring glycine dehydrogenase subunit GcvPB [Chloroflexota bacterium]
MIEPTVYEISSPGRTGPRLPELDVPEAPLPEGYVRDAEQLPLPELSELDVVRHFVRLSQKNMSIDTNFYPLGSCTMKYNPKVNELTAGLAGFAQIHPLQDTDLVQGAMQLMFELQVYLAEISGFDAVTLQPAAGAQGELAGVLMMRKYHLDRGDNKRKKILVPDSAHGTNPASTTMSGLEVVELPSDDRGNLDLAALKENLDETVVGLMLTNPNTLGLFEEHILEVTRLVHDSGGLVYGDGANLNAIVGICKPAELGIDVMHFNLHKTFSTPHGGGGPGAGPVGVVEKLASFLPGPLVALEAIVDEEPGLPFLAGPLAEEGPTDLHRLVWYTPSKSIGRVRSFAGNFGVLVRAYTYIRMLGAEGLRRVAENAVLNANYLKARLQGEGSYPIAFSDRTCMHEFVAQGILEGASGVHTLDISKRLMDYGFHPPTVYFPLIVKEALMIEPTETESKEALDLFADALIAIAGEARTDPDLLHEAPHQAPVRRLDEVRAARQAIFCRR